MSDEQAIQILIVDDNAQYRDALKGILLLEQHEVLEAEDIDEALRIVQAHTPDVVVTDLQMRTDREGLDLIEILKGYDPVLPVIMISAVGSFEEGALATRLGAVHVIHKSRIEEEMVGFLATIRQSHQEARKNREWLALIASARESDTLDADSEALRAIQRLLADPDVDIYVKSEAYECVRSSGEPLSVSDAEMRQVSESDPGHEIYDQAVGRLEAQVPSYRALMEDSRKALTTAEYLYGLQEERALLDFSRTIGFSYAFAVENQFRVTLKGKITRLMGTRQSEELIRSFLDTRGQRVDMSFQHNLLMVARGRHIQFTMENVRHLLHRMLRQGKKFKIDGLKDVGMLLMFFGRCYEFAKPGARVTVENPLRVKGLSESEVLDLAARLIALQYARNPYVHAGAGKLEKLSILRDAAINCLNDMSRVS